MAKQIDDLQLKAMIAQEIAHACKYDEGDKSDKRTSAIEYFEGTMNDVPAMANRSKVVSRDVADTIGLMLPGIMRVFMSTDKMAEFTPETEADEEYCEQAEDLANHVFFKDNDGRKIIWDATHDSLLHGNAIVKIWWEKTKKYEVKNYTNLSDEDFKAIAEEEGSEVLEHEERIETVEVPPELLGPEMVNGEPAVMEMSFHDIKVRRIKSAGRIRIDVIEPENFLKNEESICIEDARFTAHRDYSITRSDLIEMGFDRDIVERLPDYHSSDLSSETLARENVSLPIGDAADDSERRVELYENYIKVDADGDGISETVKAYYTGTSGAGELLDWEVWEDEAPFVDIPCEPVPHRFDGISITDKTADMQRMKTILERQAVDNIYATNQPVREAEAGSVLNPDMLINPKIGGTIWKKKGSPPLMPAVLPFTADKAFQAITYFDDVIEKRTGVSRATAALDPEALSNQSATANMNAKDASYSQVELVARNQAEGWRKVFKRIHQLSIRHQDKPRTIRLRDEWVEIDPKDWNADMDCTINVGLGTGSRERDVAMLNQVLMQQTAMAERFMSTGIVDKAIEYIPLIRNTLVKIAECAGLKNADEMYPEFTDDDQQNALQLAQQAAQQPNPAIELEQVKLQGQAQLKELELQAGMQAEQAKLEITREAEALKAEGNQIKEAAQLEADIAMEDKRQESALLVHNDKMHFEREKFATETRLKFEELEIKRLAAENSTHDQSAGNKRANSVSSGESGTIPQ
ncbi:MAG: hypothetical protein GY943_30545 [Chloroflexi bacterium]|nr:hypothetical protein [Chloroflexota bacterium]